MIELSTGEVPAPPATENCILLDSYILLDCDGKIWMQYVVSDPDTDDGDGTQETMSVTLTASGKGGVCGPRIP